MDMLEFPAADLFFFFFVKILLLRQYLRHIINKMITSAVTLSPWS